MFFIASKILLFLIQPLNWLALFLLYALFGKKKIWKKRSLSLAVFTLFFFSNPFIINQLIRAWEIPPRLMSSLEPQYEVGIVLGGYANLETYPQEDRLHIGGSATRITTAVELYHQKKINKILLSGGSGKILGEKKIEADAARNFLIRIGIPAADILLETDSRNTYENAMYSSKLIEDQLPGANCLLITSAWHLRRATPCFEKSGLQVTPFAVDILSEPNKLNINNWLMPNSGAFNEWNLFTKEIIGYLVYWFSGYL